jgi:hypothetical protein
MNKRVSFALGVALSSTLQLIALHAAPEAAPSKATANPILYPICPSPAALCNRPFKTFEPYELSFQLPKQIKPNITYRSTRFYGVLLKTWPLTQTDECDGGEYSTRVENERKRVHALLPRHKVFASQQCPDMAAVSYLIDGKFNNSRFLAVYGGTTQAEARRMRAALLKRYPRAAVKPMQVAWEQIMQ